MLAQVPGVIVQKISSFHETKPVGGPAGQGMYLNAAATLETTLDPFELLRVLQEIEAQFGRVRRSAGASDPGSRLATLRRFDHRHARVERPPSPTRGPALRPGTARRDRAGLAVEPVSKRTIAGTPLATSS